MTAPNDGPRRLFAGAPLIPIAIALLVGWAIAGPGASIGGGSALASLAVLTVFGLSFGALSLNLVDRLGAVIFGAIMCLFLGVLLRFYSPFDAAMYLWGKVDTLLLLGGIGVVTGVLAESGVLSHIAHRLVSASRGDVRRVALLLCLGTYLLSSLVNNLATILVIIPLSLIIADAMGIDAHVLVLGEVIASNLGGASTMMGDFPNVLIATEVGLPFHQFLWHLAPVCLVHLALLLGYLAYAVPRGRAVPRKFDLLLERLAASPVDWLPARRGFGILAMMLAGFLVGGKATPAVVAVLGGGSALLFGGVPKHILVKHLHLNDVLFFGCLFVMVGAVDALGILTGFARDLVGVSRSNPAAGLVTIAWAAALMTTVLNAGPTTALFVSTLLGEPATRIMPESTWWALSLGVCAGSSATLTGATAGPVAASLLEQRGQRLTFGDFAKIGVPLMFAFMFVNVVYLILL
jgi:Na+/H+ antiporter NhaD/arsenite permease-like protein